MSLGDWTQNEYKVLDQLAAMIYRQDEENAIPVTAFPSPLIDAAVQIIIRNSGKEDARQFLQTAIELLDQTEASIKRIDELQANRPGVWPPAIVTDNES